MEEERTIMKRTLQNAMVLRRIFCHLDTPILKSVRLVSSSWDNSAATVIGKRCLTPINFLFHGFHSILPVPINTSLLRRVSVLAESQSKSTPPQIDQDWASSESVTCFKIFSAFHHNSVQEVELITKYNTLDLLLDVFRDHSKLFPTLKRIYINYISTSQDYEPLRVAVQLNLIPTLQEFEVRAYFLPNLRCVQFQNIINAAPNLQRLLIRGNFYPDLINCQKLRYLSMSPTLVLGDNRFVNVDFGMIAGMINQVAGTLESLHLLDVDGPFRDDPRPPAYNQGLGTFPSLNRMPNLEELVINAVDFYRNIEMNLAPQIVPGLKELSLMSCGRENISGIVYETQLYTSIRRIPYIHNGIKYLTITGPENAELILYAAKLFPNVTSFRVSITKPSPSIPVSATFLHAVIHSCTNNVWKLTYLDMLFNIPSNSLGLSGLLDGLLTLKVAGIRKLKIATSSQGTVSFNEDINHNLQTFTRVLELSANMELMELCGLLLKPRTTIRLMEFLNSNRHLPVIFVD